MTQTLVSFPAFTVFTNDVTKYWKEFEGKSLTNSHWKANNASGYRSRVLLGVCGDHGPEPDYFYITGAVTSGQFSFILM